jgi:MFS family permease
MADDKNIVELPAKKLETEHVEDRPQVEGSIWNELWTVRTVVPYILIIYCCVVNVGLDAGVAGLSLGIVSFRRQFGTYLNDTAGWVIPNTYTSAWSGASVGSQTIGNMLSGIVADRWGRKWALICSAVITIIATIIMITSRTIGPLIAGKLVMGLGIGFLVAQAPAFLAEMSTPRLRGMTTIGVNFCICFGQWLASGIIWGATTRWTDVEDNTAWLVVFGLQFIFAAIFMAFVWFLPESPVYLVQKERYEEARVNARRLFGPTYNTELHVNNIILEVAKENEAQVEGKSKLLPLQISQIASHPPALMAATSATWDANVFPLQVSHIPSHSNGPIFAEHSLVAWFSWARYSLETCSY